jgi:hypothetical protein
MCLSLIVFHCILHLNVGGFWRDEVSSVLLARAGSWSKMLDGLATDSFPPLWVTILRLWDQIGGGAGDDWLQLLGMVISMGIFGSLWWTARVMRLPVPVLSFALVAFNPTVFYWGDSLRAYGLAAMLIILLFGCLWRVVEEPATGRVFAAATVAVLCAQSNYQNSYLIMGVCLGGAMVCLWQGVWKRSLLCLGIGFLSGLSLLPCIPYLRRLAAVAETVRVPIWQMDFPAQFARGFSGGSLILLLAWISLGLLGLWAWVARLRAKYRMETTVSALAVQSFSSITVLVSIIGLVLFTHLVGKPTLEWYFIPVLGLCGIAAEAHLAQMLPPKKSAVLRIVSAMVVYYASIGPVADAAWLRRTNMDILADTVAKEAKSGDFVFVSPFFSGISFAYHYRGVAPWSILPALPREEKMVGNGAENIKRMMALDQPLSSSFETLERTLKGGGRVWLVGKLLFLPIQKPVPSLPPAPYHPQIGWQSAPYVACWSMQMARHVQLHAAKINKAVIPLRQAVNQYENYQIVVLEGWK